VKVLGEECVKDNLLLDKNAGTWTGEQKAAQSEGGMVSKFYYRKATPAAAEIQIKPYALSAERMSELKMSLVNLATQKVFGD
jgi:hypothetical protein